jgi:phospholipid/cholesterol/gamma-HCH transport system substrate-binding protein
MKQDRATELGTGLFVLLGFAALFFLVIQLTNRDVSFGNPGYRLTAKFRNIGGLKVGAKIAMGGVTIGRVEGIDLDQADYRALVRMRMFPKFDKIPDDSDAAIYTAGLLGGQYIGVTPGGSDSYYKDGGRIEFTQDAVVLENLISKFLFNKASDDAAKKLDGAPASGDAAAMPASGAKQP